MLANKASETAICLAFSSLESGHTLPEGHYANVVRFLKMMDKVVLKHDNEAYTSFKALSALCVGEALLRNESWLYDELLTAVWSDLVESKLVVGDYE